MKIDFYGVNIEPPTRETVEAFGASTGPVLIRGGQGTAYRAGNIVLKPAEGDSEWQAELFQDLPEDESVRFAKPVKAHSGSCVYKKYVAWTYLEGEHVKGNYGEKLVASDAFHSLLSDVERPSFVGAADSSWAAADFVALGEREFEYEKEFVDLYEQIHPYLLSLELPSQIVHGDLSGNFLLIDNESPAIIDFSPTWAPKGFAEGVMLADVIAWENANVAELEPFVELPNSEQFAWRGIIRRIAEQAEHMRFFNKDKEQAVEEAQKFQKAIDTVKQLFRK